MSMKRFFVSVLVICCAAPALLAGEAPPPPEPRPGQPAATPARPQPPDTKPAAGRPLRLPPAGMAPGMNPGAAIQTAEAAEANPAYLNDLAQVHLRYGVVERAEPLLKSALEKATDPVQKQQVVSSMASLLQRKGDWKGAAELYEQALQGAASPAEKGRLQLSLADACMGMNEFEKAEKILNEVAAGNDQNPMGQFQRQQAQGRLLQAWQKQPGRLDKVIEETEKAAAANPQDAAAIERLADIYSNAKPDQEKATLYYEKLMALRPDDKNLQYRMINKYQMTRQFDKAVEVGQKLFVSAKTDAEKRALAMQVAQIILGAGKKADAVAWLQANFPKANASTGDLSNYAMTLEQAGMPKEADEALAQAAAAAKTPRDKAECVLRAAEMQLGRQQYDKAEELLKAVLDDCKDDPNIVQRANMTLDRIKRTKENQARQQAGQGVPVRPPRPPEPEKK
jgi:tetratricopeptide (TPR) repeat protein